MHHLERLFRPRSVAILGASTNPEKSGYKFIDTLLQTGYQGTIYPVNPKGGEVLGLRIYRNFTEIDAEVDLVLNSLGPAQTPEAIVDAAKHRAKFAVIFTAGFAEMGEREAHLEQQMVAEARTYGMRIVGPNCMGIFSLDCGLNLTGQLDLPRGSIGIISQSGNVAVTLWYDAPRLDVGFSKFIGFGNQADIPVHEYLEYLGQDEATKVITLYLEGLKADLGPDFVRVAREVSRVKPIVAVKGGRTPNGRRAAISHTASMSGEARTYSAAFRQAGIIEVDRLEELLPVAETLYRCPPFRGGRIAVVGSGGGHSILATDALEANGFEVPEFSPGVKQSIAGKLPEWAPAGNPVDMTGAFTKDLALFTDLTRIALDDPKGLGGSLNYGLYGLWGEPGMQDNYGRTYESAAPLLGQLQAELRKPILFYTPYAAEQHPSFTRMREAGVPCYPSLDLAARCLRALRERAEVLERLGAGADATVTPTRAGDEHLVPARGRPRRNLTEPEALHFLAANGLRVPSFGRAGTAPEAVALAESLGYPVVMKLISPEVIHKSDAGGVALNLRTPAEVEKAYAAMMVSVRERAPGAIVEGVLVTPFRPGGTEIIAGLLRDPMFGPMLMVGTGGIFTEVLNDVSLRVLPVDRREIEVMLRELKGFPLLAGARGKEPADLAALVDLLLGLSRVALAFPEIAELDLNPVLALSGGAVIADARIILSEERRQ